MRDIARWIRRSPVITSLVAGSGQALGGARGDVAPHRWALREARRAEKLVSAERRKVEFLAAIAHDVRDLLGVIRNAVGLLQREQEMTPAGRKAQALIDRQVRRMTQLVDDLLDVSRIRNGHLHLQRERIDLRTVVRNAVETLESEINERRQKLTLALPHVFDLFTQADAAAPCSRTGLGIGLALVHSLVALHGGRVTAASAGLGRGSEFTVRLPEEAGSRGNAVADARASADPAA